MYNYTYNEIVKALQTVGIKQGDNIFCHANLGFFGKLENAQTPDDYCKCFKNAFLDVIGPDGTLICPTFSYSFCRKEIFNPEKTKSTCGSFSEYMRKRKGSVRSYDANFSICAIGKNAQFFTQNPPEHSFGPDSFFDRFYKKMAYFAILILTPALHLFTMLKKHYKFLTGGIKLLMEYLKLKTSNLKKDFIILYVAWKMITIRPISVNLTSWQKKKILQKLQIWAEGRLCI